MEHFTEVLARAHWPYVDSSQIFWLALVICSLPFLACLFSALFVKASDAIDDFLEEGTMTGQFE